MVVDSHLHCSKGAVNLLLRAMDLAEINFGLILPWEGEDELIIEEVLRNGENRLKVAVTPKIRLVGTNQWENELVRIRNLLPNLAAIKFYKEASFSQVGELKKLDLLSRDLEPLWEMAIEYNKPVIIHCGDPIDFWGIGRGIRTEQLKMHPEWSYNMQSGILERKKIVQTRARLVDRWKNVKFIFAHMGGFPADLDELSKFLTYGYVDTSASIEELLTLEDDRSMLTTIIKKFSGSIMFGSDAMVAPARSNMDGILIRIWAKFLKDSLNMLTSKELMGTPNPREMPWRFYGLGLQDDTLERIISKNALHVFWNDPIE